MISLTSTAHGPAAGSRHGRSRAAEAYQVSSSATTRDSAFAAWTGPLEGSGSLKEVPTSDDRVNSHWGRARAGLEDIGAPRCRLRTARQHLCLPPPPPPGQVPGLPRPQTPRSKPPSRSCSSTTQDSNVDSSAAAIAADPGIEVVGEARTGRDAIALVERLRPSAVVLDLELPGMAAIEIIERIMAIRPTPILVCSTEGDAERAAAALAAGAIDVVARPTAKGADRTSYAEALRRGVRVASRVKVITHPRGRLKSRSTSTSAGWSAHSRAPKARST